ncbi:putative disease resistance RPP13-like protein 1 [Vitis vinifera]|uniref:Putative disease resistance RPP13-like protein 1 n=1 Tax=Vitis vinifera TaxID=29760 RepID=A0A438J6N8_VITVI|nr:putative disease resistance RPP13-like protein 1 [Vitis vinifera]
MAGAVAGGGALLSASLKVLLNRMDSPEVRTFLRGQKLSATLRRELKMKLLAVKAVLNDAEAKQITNSDVKDWMDELKDAVYDAEDLVDDITTEAYDARWSLILNLSVGLNGSKIIVTTRIEKVAAVMHSAPIHHLGQLSFEDCWSLFAKHAFENGDSSSHPKLEEIGKEIVKKCDGLPLAAKTLGGALYSEDDKINEIPEKLRHSSYFRGEHDSFERFDTLSEVHCLRTFLPLDLRTRHRFDKVSKSRNPVNSRHSRVKEMPSQMGQLKILEKLSNYRVGKQSGTRVGELRELSHIGGSLVIQELQNVVDAKDASEANLVGKQRLDELELEWNRDSDVEQNGAYIVLNNLQPHSNLKRLTIHRYGGSKFPDWLGGPSILNMVSLRLWNSLSFQDMPVWKEWLCLGGQGGEFPRLKELYIKNCPKLTGDLPNHLPLLMQLEIEECEQLVAPLPRVSSHPYPCGRICLPIELKSLRIEECKKLEFLLPEFFKCHHPSLAYLFIFRSTCNSLSFNIPLSKFPRLARIQIWGLEGLESLSISISGGDLTTFAWLNIGRCPNLVSIELPALNISRYSIVGCENLKVFPPILTSLSIKNCDKLTSQVEWGLQGLPSLTSLTISGPPNLMSLDDTWRREKANHIQCHSTAEYGFVPPKFRWWHFESLEQFPEEALPKPPYAIYGPLVAKVRNDKDGFTGVLYGGFTSRPLDEQYRVKYYFHWNSHIVPIYHVSSYRIIQVRLSGVCKDWVASLRHFSIWMGRLGIIPKGMLDALHPYLSPNLRS